jgi:hypothetical protein
MGLPEVEESPCGSERYSIRITDIDTNKVLYDELVETVNV